MTLVNDTDANRDNIDDYLKELEQLSGHQLSLLSTLREVSDDGHPLSQLIFFRRLIYVFTYDNGSHL